MEVYESDIFQQSCVAQSNPSPVINWHKDGQQILVDSSITITSPTPSMSIIMIGKVHRSHAGKYTCVASNEAGVVEESVLLKVKGILSHMILVLFMKINEQLNVVLVF